VPPLAVLAGIGFNLVLEWAEARSRRLARAAFAGVAVWLLWTGSVLMRLHPYEYLYFNETVGGLRGAAQRYDTDYWVMYGRRPRCKGKIGHFSEGFGCSHVSGL